MTRRNDPRGSMSAEDFLAELQGDEAYQEKRRRQDEELERRSAELGRAEAPLVRELREAGFDVESVWDLVNTDEPYPEALPILVNHLSRPYPDRVRAGIARALAVRDATFAVPVLLRLYRAEPAGTSAKEGLAAALGEAADDSVIGEIVALVSDTSLGTNRVLMLDALARSKTARAREALNDLATDPQIGEEAARLLRRTRTTRRI